MVLVFIFGFINFNDFTDAFGDVGFLPYGVFSQRKYSPPIGKWSSGVMY